MGKQTKRKVSSVDKKGKRRERKIKEERRRIEREREKWEKETKREIFQAFRWLKLDGPRRKVDQRIESYVWVPKSWSFIKFHEVGNFPTWVIYSLKAI